MRIETIEAPAMSGAVLAKAFRGELVPMESELVRREGRGYKPAGAMLERVQASWQAGHTMETLN